ncbi:MAG: DUF3394 domain-containing protein [Halocynthiibacter sp.]
MDFGWVIKELQIPVERIAKEWFYIPAYLLLALIILLQMPRRKRREDAASPLVS